MRSGIGATASGLIHLKLRQEGLLVNYKRVERIYQEAKLCKYGAASARRCWQVEPTAGVTDCGQPGGAMDFVFDRTAEERVIRYLTIVVDAIREAIAIEVNA